MCGTDYLLVVVVAVVLSGANVVGYTKCSKQASAQLKSYATQAVTSGLTVRCWHCTRPSCPQLVHASKGKMSILSMLPSTFVCCNNKSD